MKKQTFWLSIGAVPIVTFGSVVALAQSGSAADVKVTCQTSASAPTVVVTLAKAGAAQNIPILNFLPKYFSPDTAVQTCQSTATRLQTLYTTGNGEYLTTDRLNNRPVVCAVERRGMSCNHESAQVLFSLKPTDNPAQALYDMLGTDFKPAKPLDARTVGRIYTGTRLRWWLF